MHSVQWMLPGLSLVLFVVGIATAENEQAGTLRDPQVIMETYEKAATPGAPHKLMASRVGTWKTTTKAWMEPGGPPMETAGSCEQTMLLGGRFLRQECIGEIMGQSFTGIGLNGYDNHSKKYMSTWMDSMGTAIYYMEGTGSADGKTITQRGQYDDPVEGLMQLRSVTRLVDRDHEIFEMYGTDASGKERKMMEITYTRMR